MGIDNTTRRMQESAAERGFFLAEAMVTGSPETFIAGQERAGQHQLVTSELLPADHGDDAPYEDEVARGGHYALTTLRLVFPVPASLLPAAPDAAHRPGEVEETARHAVAALAGHLNQVTGPVIETLERQ